MGNDRKNTAAEQAYQLILKKIIDDRLEPGTRLRETQLASELGISTTPVREALRCLEFDNWVQNVPHCGCVVRSITLEEVRGNYLLREGLECVAAREFIRRNDKKSLAALEQVLKREEAMVSQISGDTETITNTDEYFRLDMEFHQLIMRGANSVLLAQQHAKLRAQLNCLHFRQIKPVTKAHIQRVNRQHGTIYNALAFGWTEAAEDAVRSHIRCAAP